MDALWLGFGVGAIVAITRGALLWRYGRRRESGLPDVIDANAEAWVAGFVVLFFVGCAAGIEEVL